MGNEELRVLSERIQYLPATENPLSADVGIVRGDRRDWIFDVGSSETAFRLLQECRPEKNIVLSHFHGDHTGNMARIDFCQLYCGSWTRSRLQLGTEVCGPVAFDDGAHLTIFPLPSTHSKGAVGLVVNGEYAFLGDAVYGAEKNGRTSYNVNVLKEMIAALEAVPARYFLLSHDAAFARPKDRVLSELKTLYSLRKPGEPFVFPGDSSRE